jgi:HK97 family phage major capsid protein/HK97 family phage prohead protease
MQSMNTVFIRALQDAADPFVFVASTDSVDRYGDVIQQDGWVLSDFRKNPIALWMHNHDQPVGIWENIKVDGGKLVAKLKLAAQGTSTLIDTLRSLIEQRILRAVSVGFRPLKYEPLLNAKGEPTGGYRFLKQELLEISVVTVPANQEALATARAKGLRSSTLDKIFCPPGTDDLTKRMADRPTAAPTTSTSHKGTKSMNLAERIAAAEAKAADLRDKITELAAIDNATDEQLIELTERTTELEATTKLLGQLQSAQRALAASAAPAGARTTPAAPASIQSRGTTDPATLMFRAATVHLRSFFERRSVDDILRSNWNAPKDLEAIVKAAVDPAMTGVQGWAAELVGETVGGFVDVLRPDSIFFRVPMGQFTFGRGKIKLPGRDPAGGTLAGSFVGEGAPIPVRKMGLLSTPLEPHKLGVITTFTREIAAMSDPQIEPLLRDAMVQDTRETLDTLFLDATAAVAGIRPAGLQNLAGSNTVASSGTTLANIITDLREAISAMTSGNMGRNLVWIMNKQRIMSLSLVTNAAGTFMFRDELANNRLLGIPVLTSTTVPAGVVFLVDAAELATAYDSMPQMDVSEQATLHMEDTAPKQIVVAGTGAAGATAVTDIANPVRSMFQTASIALRLLWDLTWAQRRQGAVFTVTGVAW